MEYAIKIVVLLAVLWFMFKLTRWSLRNLHTDNPLWLSRYKSLTEKKRRTEMIQGASLGLFFVVIAVLTFTYEQDTANLYVHLFGIGIGFCGFSALAQALALQKKLLLLQIGNPRPFSIIRTSIAIGFSAYSTCCIIYSVLLSDWSF